MYTAIIRVSMSLACIPLMHTMNMNFGSLRCEIRSRLYPANLVFGLNIEPDNAQYGAVARASCLIHHYLLVDGSGTASDTLGIYRR